MKKIYILFLIIFAGLGTTAQPSKRPKLLVGIVVDQMRYDYLYRFYSNYGSDGFKRLMKEGTHFRKTYLPYIPSFTAVGHSCIYTGSVPALTGIVGNDWMDRHTNTKVYCVADSTVETVGSSSDAGLMSPRNLIASTISDEYILGTNFASRAYGISIKDRGAILPAGHLGKAFWYDAAVGGFISSTYYMDSLPDWVINYNVTQPVDSYYAQDWNLLLDRSKYTASSEDDNKWEGFHKLGANVFPHNLKQYIGQMNDIIRATPFGNTMTLQFAKEMIINENLGMGEHHDLLAISLSSTDYVGHIFGPQSMETEDTYIRLDRDLGDFFKFLDREIGKDEYVVFLTSDHGVAHNAGFMDSIGMPAGYLWTQNAYDSLSSGLDKAFGRHDFLGGILNYSIHFNVDKFGKLDKEEVYDFVINWFMNDDDINFALDLHSPKDWIIPEKLKHMVMNNVYHKRVGDILLIPAPQHYAAYFETGTTHGTWNPYDSHIPLLFMGKGIESGDVIDEVYMTDIAPTLADILYLQEPNASIGKSLFMYLK